MLSLLWGGSFFLTEIILEEISPFTQVAVRVGLGAAVLYAWITARGMTLPRGIGHWSRFLTMGVLNNVIPFSLIVWGQTRISGGLASIINAATPLFTILLAVLLVGGERVNGLKLAGVLTGLAGVALLVGSAAMAGADNQFQGQLAVAGAAVSYAAAALYGRRLGDYPAPVAATGMLIGSSAVMAPLALATGGEWFLPSPGVLMSLVILGAGSTALAYLIYFRLLADAGSLNLMLVTFLIPPSALLLELLFLDHPPTARQLVGMMVIFAGLALCHGGTKRSR